METIDKLYECANCAKHIKRDELKTVRDYDKRVEADDPVKPDGECPSCGCLAYEITEPKWKPDDFRRWVIEFLVGENIGPDDAIVSIGPKGANITIVRDVVDLLIGCEKHVQQAFKDKALELKRANHSVLGLLSAIADVARR